MPGEGDSKGIGVGICKILQMNFYEKALFVKSDVAAALCDMNANCLCPSRYASIRCE